MRKKEMPEIVDNCRIIYYYKNSKLIGNICTVCLLIGENNKLLARGIAIRSLYDSHRKSTGRNISLGRAVKALKNKYSTEEIIPTLRNINGEYFSRKKINIKSPFMNEILSEISFFNLHGENIKINNEEYLTVVIATYFSIGLCAKLFMSCLYKSAYEPEPTPHEIKLIGNKQIKIF